VTTTGASCPAPVMAAQDRTSRSRTSERIVAALTRAETCPHRPKSVQVRETHISWVFLASMLAARRPAWRAQEPVDKARRAPCQCHRLGLRTLGEPLLSLISLEPLTSIIPRPGGGGMPCASRSPPPNDVCSVRPGASASPSCSRPSSPTITDLTCVAGAAVGRRLPARQSAGPGVSRAEREFVHSEPGTRCRAVHLCRVGRSVRQTTDLTLTRLPSLSCQLSSGHVSLRGAPRMPRQTRWRETSGPSPTLRHSLTSIARIVSAALRPHETVKASIAAPER
jgi:hypothetical protein